MSDVPGYVSVTEARAYLAERGVNVTQYKMTQLLKRGPEQRGLPHIIDPRDERQRLIPTESLDRWIASFHPTPPDLSAYAGMRLLMRHASVDDMERKYLLYQDEEGTCHFVVASSTQGVEAQFSLGVQDGVDLGLIQTAS